MTLSRSVIVTAAGILVLIGVVTGRMRRLVAMVAIIGIGALAFLVASNVSADTITRLFAAEDASATGHVNAITRSLDVIQGSPLGLGLGTAGTIGQRILADQAITNENWYLQIATEMGIAMGVLFLAIVVALLGYAAVSYRRARDFWVRTLCLGVAVCAVAFLVLGNVLHAWENTVLSMFIWLLAGLAVRGPELERQEGWSS
jgi:O-antigen ligase